MNFSDADSFRIHVSGFVTRTKVKCWERGTRKRTGQWEGGEPGYILRWARKGGTILLGITGSSCYHRSALLKTQLHPGSVLVPCP